MGLYLPNDRLFQAALKAESNFVAGGTVLKLEVQVSGTYRSSIGASLSLFVIRLPSDSYSSKWAATCAAINTFREERTILLYGNDATW